MTTTKSSSFKIAQAENIYSVILDANSTTTEYVLKFLEKTRYGKYLLIDAVSRRGQLNAGPLGLPIKASTSSADLMLCYTAQRRVTASQVTVCSLLKMPLCCFIII